MRFIVLLYAVFNIGAGERESERILIPCARAGDVVGRISDERKVFNVHLTFWPIRDGCRSTVA
jgi:hypothetical protein